MSLAEETSSVGEVLRLLKQQLGFEVILLDAKHLPVMGGETTNGTVPLKSKLTLETRTSRHDPRASMLETFEDRVSSIEDRVSSIEKQGFLEYAKT